MRPSVLVHSQGTRAWLLLPLLWGPPGCRGEASPPEPEPVDVDVDVAGASAAPTAATVEAPPAIDAAEVERMLAAYADNGEFSGVVGASRAGELLLLDAHGEADLDAHRLTETPDTFHIASLSKTFTAAAISRLEAAGALGLDDPLSRFLPSFPRSGEITIRHLLRHESGIADVWSRADVETRSRQPISLTELVTWIGEAPLEFTPGERSAYSNSGYAVLAAVVEKASGAPFYRYLRDAVIKPAGLSSTSELPPQGRARTRGYEPAWTESRRREAIPHDPSILIGAGSLWSSAPDLLKWCETNLADGTFAGDGRYPFGWGVRQAEGVLWAEQSGRNPGFAAYLAAAPERRVCVVVLSNTESEAAFELGQRLFAHLHGAPLQIPNRRAVLPLEDSVERYLGRYEVSPGFILEVQARGGHLELRGGHGPLLPLERVGDDQFFYRQLHTQIDVARDETGRVEALLWGGQHRCARVEP